MIGTDPRDERLAAVLDEAVRHLSPDPEGRLPSIRRGGAVRRMLRWAAVGTSVVVASAAIGWAALWLRDAPPDRPASPRPEWETYTQVVLDWSLRYPTSWHVQDYHEECGEAGLTGALVANVDHEFPHPLIPNGCTSAGDMRELPSDLVAVELFSYQRPHVAKGVRDTNFPVSLDQAEAITPPVSLSAPTPRVLHLLPLVIQGRPHTLSVWFGREASETDEGVARQIVASIRHTPWHTHHDESLGFTVSYPPAWGAQPFQHDCPPEGTRYIVSGVIISNLHDDLRPAEGCGEGWDLAGAPPDTVVIEIARRTGGPSPGFSGPDTKFPLSLTRVTPATDSSTRFGAPGDEGVLEVGRDGTHRFTVRVWFGSGASHVNVEVIQRIVESIALTEPAP